MKEKIQELIDELNVDIEKLDIEIRAKSSKLSKLQVLKMELQKIIQMEK